jgi:hypothetical protein
MAKQNEHGKRARGFPPDPQSLEAMQLGCL